ncbi:hypothetical protein ACGFZP_13055 [Kitasatospora sp. NPDC048239]|uniref:hypothetical protein n=1 Tax=Kitasatospora sp. NPDC048239 TaxID=3364046 RepID=UPI003712A39E
MIAVTVARPTENTAVGLMPVRELGNLGAYHLARFALKTGDMYGARLFTKSYLRALAGGKVGESL